MPRMKSVAIVRHAAHEGPGYFAEFLDRHRIPHHMIRIDANDPVPQSLDGISGLVLMGGPMSVNDDLPWIPRVIRLIQTAVARDVPVLGHCLGGQLLAKALGGVVSRNPVREIGWLPVERVDGPIAREWLNGLPPRFDVYHWHGETFTIPDGATRILASYACPNQAYAFGKHLGMQCHVEMTPALIESWTATGADELIPSRTVQTREQMLIDVEKKTSQLHRVADVLYTRWIQGLA